MAAGDCKACHGSEIVRPKDHVDTRAMERSECAGCHKKAQEGLRTKIPLSHLHQLNGITCGDCHEKPDSAKPLTTEECLSCHDTRESVGQATANSDPNPHNSPHYGPDLDCDLCHHQHATSENFCSQCHEWKLKVP